IIGSLILLLSSFGFVYLTGYLSNTYDFLTGMRISEYDNVSYSVIVLKDSQYQKIEDLKNKTVSYLEDEHNDNLKEKLNDVISYKENKITDLGSISTILEDGTTDALILENSYLSLIKEEDEKFEEKIKIIYSFEIQVKNHVENSDNINITEDPFILYISGIDQYGNVNSIRGRSDVNQIAVINPRTHHILLVNTPRDYYVQLHNTTGLKDKLTHAGIYGINKSITTLEDLYNININNYLRVNFDSLIKVVDAIGGIDINSDTAFRAHTNKNVYVKEGWNHFDGASALAYARERYAYITGDNHRGANQQQVIAAIIEKVSSSKVIIGKYNDILKSLEGTFQTDMSTNTIQSFIRYQIDKMPKWKIESIAVTGSGSSNYTYSMGTNYKLYVMEPNMESVNKAKQKINEVLNEK
ncbi:MAG: LCP family protein, partial [Bacilli bacterium]|nr:LCP family protein [Bacilli bacterium]